MSEIRRAKLDTAWHLETLGNLQALEVAVADMAGGHELLLGGLKEDILVDLEFAGAALLQIDALGATEALEFMGLDLDLPYLALFGIFGGDLVIEVILAGDPEGHRLELHVQILGDEDGWGLILFLNSKAGCHDLVINLILVGEDLGEPPDRCGGMIRVQCIIDKDADGASPGRGDAADHFLGLMIKGLGQEAMDGTCIGSALGLLVLELVHLSEDLDRNEDVVVLKAVQAVRVMEQDIRIEDEVLHRGRIFFEFLFTAGLTGWNYRKEDVLFFGGFHRGGSVHGGCFYNDGVWINGKWT